METELAVTRRAIELVREAVPPKKRFEAIEVMVAEGRPITVCCRVLNISESGFHMWRKRPQSARAIRHAWLTEQIRRLHADSRGTYGGRRVHAELTLGLGIAVGHRASGNADAAGRDQGSARFSAASSGASDAHRR
ncbi:IS3 family transposase [Spirillospora sp. CA-255316]